MRLVARLAMMANPERRWLLVLSSAAFFSAPLALIATWLMAPFWRWFEALTGVEALGHSGPADWCYGLAWLLITTAAFLLLSNRRR